MYYSLNECGKGLNFYESWPSSQLNMHDSSGNMAVNLNFIYLHRYFVNRSFVLLNKKWNSLQVFTLTSEEGGLVTITFEINMASLALGRHVRLFVVDDVLSKLKGFSFNKGKVIEVIVRIKSSLHFYREKDLFLSSSKK